MFLNLFFHSYLTRAEHAPLVHYMEKLDEHEIIIITQRTLVYA